MNTVQEHVDTPCEDFCTPLLLFLLFDKPSYNILAFRSITCDGMFCSSLVAKGKQMHPLYIRKWFFS